ncbi:MAG: RNA polymerase sigma factor [Terriglobales bacterium]
MAVGKPSKSGSRSLAAERLLVQAAQEDPARFAELYESNFHRVYGYVIRRTRDRSVAEDLTADVFHKALAALPNFDWRGIPFSAWLIRIAANVMTDEWKRGGKEELIAEIPDGADPTGFGSPALEENDERERLFRAFGKLPEDQRQVVDMRFAEGRSICEIAQQLGRSEGAVKQLQFRALKTLRARMEEANG